MHYVYARSEFKSAKESIRNYNLSIASLMSKPLLYCSIAADTAIVWKILELNLEEDINLYQFGLV